MSSRLNVPLGTLLLGLAPPAELQGTFCRQCLADLRAARASRPDPRLSFRGPVLVRQEEDYSIGFLPGCTKLSFEANRKLDWKELRGQLRPLIRRYSDRLHSGTSSLYLRDAPKTLRGKGLAVERAAKDPNPLVAQVAAGLLDQLGKRRR